MGQVKNLSYLVALVLLCAAALAVSLKPEGKVQHKNVSLVPALSQVDGWKVTAVTPLQESIIESLQLDDYLFQTYAAGSREVGLYIGFYQTLGKVGAAHDPLVCLPGQGWVVVSQGHGKLAVEVSGMPMDISYSTMTVERNGEKEIFMYWFQAYDKAVAGTLSQKIVSLVNKIHGLGQDNAFVRLSCSMKDRTEEQCMQNFSDFIAGFYPEFIYFIKGQDAAMAGKNNRSIR